MYLLPSQGLAVRNTLSPPGTQSVLSRTTLALRASGNRGSEVQGHVTCPVPPSFSSQRESGQYPEHWRQSPGPPNPSRPLGFHIPSFYRDHDGLPICPVPGHQCPHVSTPKGSLGPLSPDKQTHLGARRRRGPGPGTRCWGEEGARNTRGKPCAYNKSTWGSRPWIQEGKDLEPSHSCGVRGS